MAALLNAGTIDLFEGRSISPAPVVMGPDTIILGTLMDVVDGVELIGITPIRDGSNTIEVLLKVAPSVIPRQIDSAPLGVVAYAIIEP